MLDELRNRAAIAETAFMTTLLSKYPRADKWVWFRAIEKAEKGAADKWDLAMASDKDILAAHDAYLAALHAFYLARDGSRGVLGSRGV